VVNFERIYKLYKLNFFVQKEYFEPIQWFDNLCKILIFKETNNYNGFYLDDKIAIIYDIKNRHITIEYDRIWSIFEYNYMSDDENIKSIIKTIVKGNFGINANKVQYFDLKPNDWFELPYELKNENIR